MCKCGEDVINFPPQVQSKKLHFGLIWPEHLFNYVFFSVQPLKPQFCSQTIVAPSTLSPTWAADRCSSSIVTIGLLAAWQAVTFFSTFAVVILHPFSNKAFTENLYYAKCFITSLHINQMGQKQTFNPYKKETRSFSWKLRNNSMLWVCSTPDFLT